MNSGFATQFKGCNVNIIEKNTLRAVRALENKNIKMLSLITKLQFNASYLYPETQKWFKL